MTPTREPDWDRLRRISEQAARESAAPGWTLARWRELLAEAEAATHGHGEYTEFMAAFEPR